MAHTADVILQAWGPDLASCCEEAVAALVATFVAAVPEDMAVVPEGMAAEHRAHLAAASPETLLLAILDEVIFTLDTAEAVPVAAQVRDDGRGGLDVVLRLADRRGLEPTGAVPKAVSRSELQVDVEPARVFCRFLVDL